MTRMEELIGGDPMRRAEARRERELGERLQQEDARISAEGAPASAPAPGSPRYRTTSDVVEDGSTHQSETRGAVLDRAQPLHVPKIRLSILGAVRPYGAHPRATSLGVRIQSDSVGCSEARPKPIALHGCERTDSRPENPPPDGGDADADPTNDDLRILSAIV